MKRLIAVLMLLVVFTLGACSTTIASAEQNNPLKVWFHSENGVVETWCVVDDETGVNYVVVSGGRYDSGIGITPRLNADGSLYTS